MSPYLTREDTGYPAPITEGWGLYYTREHVMANQKGMRLQSVVEEVAPAKTPIRPAPILRNQPRTGRYKPVPRDISKTCANALCGKTFLGNQKETLCSDECREQTRRERRAARRRRAASPGSYGEPAILNFNEATPHHT